MRVSVVLSATDKSMRLRGAPVDLRADVPFSVKAHPQRHAFLASALHHGAVVRRGCEVLLAASLRPPEPPGVCRAV